MLRKILLVFIALFIIIQLVRPAKNLSADNTHSMSTAYPVPAGVNKILETSCADCHSNKTVYPWYADVQPAGWWPDNHIKNGKRHWNIDDFTDRRIAWQYKKMDDCIEQLHKGEMPLDSYLWIHRYAKLSAADKQTLIDWCESVKAEIKSRYPADSLVMPKRKGQ